MGITDTILTPARRTAITGLIGLLAEFSSVLVRGMDGVARGAGAAGVGAVAGAVGATATVGVTATAGATDVAGGDMDSLAAAALRMGRLADSMELPEVSAALTDSMAAAFTVEVASMAEVVDSTEVADTAAAVIDNSGIAVLDAAGSKKAAGSAVLLAVFVFAAARFLARMSGFVGDDRSKIATFSPGD
jgi:hypothetical protein